MIRTTFLMLAAILACAVGLYWSTVHTIGDVWLSGTSDTYSVGFLVFPISFYLAWKRQEVLARLPRARWIGMVLIGFLGILWAFSEFMSVLTFQQVAWVALLPACVWAIAGYDTFKRWLFPAGFLFLALPLGEAFIPVLQDFTALFAVKALQLTGIPVHFEGRFISIPGAEWVVAEACSGVRYVIASLIFGYLYAGLFYRTWVRRVAFLVLSMVFPVLSNGMRAYIVIVLAYAGDHRVAMGIDHFLVGWVFFGIEILMMVGIGYLWRETQEVQALMVRVDTQTPEAAVGATESGWVKAGILLTTLVMLSIGPFWVFVAARAAEKQVIVPTTVPTLSLSAPWRIDERGPDHWKPVFHGHTTELFQSFTSGAQVVTLFIAYYPRQSQGAEAVNDRNTLLEYESRYWRRLWQGEEELTIDGQRVSVNRMDIRSEHQPDQKRVILAWYWVDQLFTANPIYTKVLQVRSYSLARPPQAAAIVISAEYGIEPTEAVHSIQDFLTHHSLTSLLAQFPAKK